MLFAIRTETPDQASRKRAFLFAAAAETAVGTEDVVALVFANLFECPGPAADLADLGEALRVAHGRV